MSVNRLPMLFCIIIHAVYSLIIATSSRNFPHIYLILIILLTIVIQTAHHGTLLVTKGRGYMNILRKRRNGNLEIKTDPRKKNTRRIV
jgi:hypothetical protein